MTRPRDTDVTAYAIEARDPVGRFIVARTRSFEAMLHIDEADTLHRALYEALCRAASPEPLPEPDNTPPPPTREATHKSEPKRPRSITDLLEI